MTTHKRKRPEGWIGELSDCVSDEGVLSSSSSSSSLSLSSSSGLSVFASTSSSVSCQTSSSKDSASDLSQPSTIPDHSSTTSSSSSFASLFETTSKDQNEQKTNIFERINIHRLNVMSQRQLLSTDVDPKYVTIGVIMYAIVWIFLLFACIQSLLFHF